LKTKQVRPQWR